MSSRTERTGRKAALAWSIPAILLVAGLAILYGPPLVAVAQSYWSEGQSTHAPLLLAGILFGMWEARRLFTWHTTRSERRVAALLLVGGLATYCFAALLGFVDIVFASALPIVIGIILLTGGTAAVRRLWPLELALVFAVPISNTSLDGIFLPAKIVLTKIVVAALASLGYPVAASGAVINVGFDTLLIADACTGLQSLWALISVGLLFVFFEQPKHGYVTAILLLFTAPLAILANILRLIVLVLVCYHFGSQQAQRFHDWAAYFEVAVAFLMFFGLNYLITLPTRARHAR